MSYAIGECRTILRTLDADRFQCVVTSPPYWGLRDYGHDEQLGLERTPDEYVANMVDVFREVRRVLRSDGVLWLNLGDSYASAAGGYVETGAVGATSMAVSAATRAAVVAHRGRKPPDGLKAKDLCGIPWRVAFALQADGWWLRQDIIWHKPNPMPESVTDRCTKAHEYVFLLSKSAAYHYDREAIAEETATEFRPPRGLGAKTRLIQTGIEHSTLGGNGTEAGTRNARSVWTIATQPYPGSHFATMPPTLAERCILASTRIGDEVLDPFLGSGTVGMVAERNGRRWFGCELNPAYEPLIKQRTAQRGLFTGDAA